MDQIQSVPRVLTSTKEMHQTKDTMESDPTQLKKQVSKFVSDIKNQFSTLIGKYQEQISNLQQESRILRQTVYGGSSPGSSPKRSNRNFRFDSNQELRNISESPILPMKSNKLDRKTSSQFYRTGPISDMKFPEWESSAFEIKNVSPSKSMYRTGFTSPFPEELINPEFQIDSPPVMHRSRFQRASESKRRKQEEIVHFLEQRGKNMNQTTEKMLERLGKKKPKSGDSDSEDEVEYSNEDSRMGRTQEDALNQSLSQICGSLDNSFISQRARKSKRKQKLAEQNKKKEMSERQMQNEKIRKERAIKNVLKGMRENAKSTKPAQTMIKASKLIPAGPKVRHSEEKMSKLMGTNSKVMINPVATNHSRLMNEEPSKQQTHQRSNEKRPASILRNSSNVLSRSISGISAISFEQ